jgi:hypothetical protein
MDCVYESRREFKRRANLLLDVLVSDVARIVTEYAVTEYQLFEESLLRHYHAVSDIRHYHAISDIRGEPNNARLFECNHPFMKQYLQYLGDGIFGWRRPIDRLNQALRIVLASEYCNRAKCYHESALERCGCGRPLISRHIRNGLVIPYF